MDDGGDQTTSLYCPGSGRMCTGPLCETAAVVNGTALWALPHPSGLNAHETVDSLAEHWRTVWDAANTGDESDQPYETNGGGCSALGEDEQG